MKILVLGAGTMGSGIAQSFAQSGHDVIIRDLDDEYVKKGIAGIDKNLSRSVKKERLTEEQKIQILEKISGTTDIKYAEDVDLVRSEERRVGKECVSTC